MKPIFFILFILFFFQSSFSQYAYSSVILCSGSECMIPPVITGAGPLLVPPSAIQVEKPPVNQLLAILTGNPEGNLQGFLGIDSPIIRVMIALAVIITITIRVKQKSEKGEKEGD